MSCSCTRKSSSGVVIIKHSLRSYDSDWRRGLEDNWFELLLLFTHNRNQGLYISRVRDHSKNPKHSSSILGEKQHLKGWWDSFLHMSAVTTFLLHLMSGGVHLVSACMSTGSYQCHDGLIDVFIRSFHRKRYSFMTVQFTGTRSTKRINTTRKLLGLFK